MLVHWLWLASKNGISDRIKRDAIGYFQDAEGVYHARDYDMLEELSAEGCAALEDKSLFAAEKLLATCARLGVHIVTLQDAAYPAKLKSISDPPLVLYYKGVLPDFDSRPVIGIVGTRRASSYGLTVAKRMGYQIAKCGGIMVSGMADGIDGVATAGTLAADGAAVGILGTAIDKIYPACNRKLFGQMEEMGCLISEYPPGYPFGKWTFPRRNRIISGLSDGVLVVEAPKGSGALITARRALEQGRDIFVVPGNLDVASCAGSNALLRDGAAMVTSGWDVMREYEASYPGKVIRWEQEQPVFQEEVPVKLEQKPHRITLEISRPEKKEIDNRQTRLYIDLEKDAPDLSEEERFVVDRLRKGACLTDELMADAGAAAGSLLAAVTMLEIKGLLRRLPGNKLELM